MTQPQANRRRRSRSRKDGPRSPEPQANGNTQTEDARTFWERSNARLGVEGTSNDAGSRKGRGPVEYPCAVCGTMVMMDRWPKHRHEARCEPCRAQVSSMLDDDDEVSGNGVVASRPPASPQGARIEGLPEMTAEDLEAMAELRASRGGSDPRVPSGGGGANRQRRRGPPPHAMNGGPPRHRNGGAPGSGNGGAPEKGDGGGGRRRRRTESGEPVPAGD